MEVKKGEKNFPKKRFYHQVGIVDGGVADSENGDVFSISAKQRAI